MASAVTFNSSSLLTAATNFQKQQAYIAKYKKDGALNFEAKKDELMAQISLYKQAGGTVEKIVQVAIDAAKPDYQKLIEGYASKFYKRGAACTDQPQDTTAIETNISKLVQGLIKEYDKLDQVLAESGAHVTFLGFTAAKKGFKKEVKAALQAGITAEAMSGLLADNSLNAESTLSKITKVQHKV